jgi:phosphoribosylformylglycinamidine synthase
MRIGMGGGAASSMAAGTNTAALDFDSVQRGNPEIQRRAQEVINHCWALGEMNPVLAIHDVGAGGISNAFPELVDGAGKGATFDLRRVPLEETGLAPKESLVQREPGTLRAGHQPRPDAALPADVRARALPVRRGGRDHRPRELILEMGPVANV